MMPRRTHQALTRNRGPKLRRHRATDAPPAIDRNVLPRILGLTLGRSTQSGNPCFKATLKGLWLQTRQQPPNRIVQRNSSGQVQAMLKPLLVGFRPDPNRLRSVAPAITANTQMTTKSPSRSTRLIVLRRFPDPKELANRNNIDHIDLTQSPWKLLYKPRWKEIGLP